MGVKEIAKAVWKRVWLVALLAVIAGGTAATFTAIMITPTYEASTKLIVNKSVDVDGEPVLSWDSLSVNTRLIATYKELIKTEAIMDDVRRRNPEIDLTSAELIDKVNVSSVNDTQVMTVVVEDDTYAQAALIVNAVSEVFKAKISEIMHVDNVTILNLAPTDADTLPVSPNMLFNVIAAVVLALLLGIGLSILFEQLDDSIRSEDDVARTLGLPVLSIIPEMSHSELTKRNGAKAGRKAGDNVYVATN